MRKDRAYSQRPRALSVKDKPNHEGYPKISDNRDDSNKDNSLVCPKCGHGLSFSCQICGSTMDFAPDAGNGLFTWPLCGYRLIPDEKILPTITEEYVIAAYYLETDDPRLKGQKLVITKTDLEGHQRTDMVKSW